MLNRISPEVSASEAFTELDQYLLDELLPDKTAPPTNAVSRSLCAETGTPRRLSCPRSRPASRQYRHLERPVATDGYRTWNHDGSSTELWVIERVTTRLH
jgi:hypothetical protein